ncbi:MAG: PAS domain S-box protein [Deltaproteobacteria bacterium]|nr:PAS domain S-box protein [Deltaproteobacteria bacterium]
MDLDLPDVEETLSRSNAFLKNLILSSVDGVIASDMKGKILIFNEAASSITGYDAEHALTRLDIRDIYPGDGAREVMKKLRSDGYGGRGKLMSEQVNVFSKDGEEIPISLSASVVYEKGREVATIGFFRDLRQQLKMEKELKQTQMQLLQAEKMSSLGKLAAGVAHQLNNPLGGIILYARLLQEEYDLPRAAREDLARIVEGAQRSKDIVKQLLEFARQTRHETRPENINQALERTLFLLENQSLFQNIDIQRRLDETLPPVPCDAQQLNQAFMNIILNAAEAMDGNGTLILATRAAQNGEYAEVEIADTGPGIPEQDLPRLFEPFFTTKEQGRGTGLGLSLAYGIVANHGGTIQAKNRPEGGASFILRLPLNPPGSQA